MVVVFLLGSVLASASDGKADAMTAILKQFPEYHLLTLQERDSELKAFLAQHSPNVNPSLVRADFNGDGNLDYALLLKADKTGAAKLVVLLCSTDGQCESVYDVDETTYASVAYLRPVSTRSKVSQTEAVPRNTSAVKVRSTRIEVNYFKKVK